MDIKYEDQLDYTFPLHNFEAPVLFNVFYYGITIPVSYLGNLFTFIIVNKMLQYRDSTADVLVGGLALNDVLTAIIVFTPSLISAMRGQYFGSREMCEFSAVTTVWYIYTTFAMLVLISAERWLAITRPFLYKRLTVTGFKLKVIMGLQGFGCLMLASIPLLRYPVTLKAGWYCTPAIIAFSDGPALSNTSTAAQRGGALPLVRQHIISTTTIRTSADRNDALANVSGVLGKLNVTARLVWHDSALLVSSSSSSNNSSGGGGATSGGVTSPVITSRAVTGIGPVLETLYIKLFYLVLGIGILVSCNVSIACTLKKRRFGDAACRDMDRKFAHIMGVVAALFLLTWLPNLAAHAACVAGSPVCYVFEFWAMRIVNIGVAVNPFVYGVMKTTYRRGYLYLARLMLYYVTLTLVPRLPDGEEIFDLRDRNQIILGRATSLTVALSPTPTSNPITATTSLASKIPPPTNDTPLNTRDSQCLNNSDGDLQCQGRHHRHRRVSLPSCTVLDEVKDDLDEVKDDLDARSEKGSVDQESDRSQQLCDSDCGAVGDR